MGSHVVQGDSQAHSHTLILLSLTQCQAEGPSWEKDWWFFLTFEVPSEPHVITQLAAAVIIVYVHVSVELLKWALSTVVKDKFYYRVNCPRYIMDTERERERAPCVVYPTPVI